MSKTYMEIDDYAMRAIEEEDLPQLLAWRNSPEIHSKMLTDHIISWEEHVEWFQRTKEHNPPLNFAFTYKGNLAGYIGYPRYDSVHKTCDIGNYLGLGLNLPVDAGVYIGEMLRRYAFGVLGIKTIITEVFVDNRRVLKLNQLAGGRIIDEYSVKKDGAMKNVAKIELRYSDWLKSNNLHS